MELAGQMIGEMLTAHADRHPANPARFVEAYARTMAHWMEESGFQSGCPIATVLLETAPRSEPMCRRGQAVFDDWIDIIAGVYRNAGMPKAQSLATAQSLIAAMEGALILARVSRSIAPIQSLVRTFQSRTAAPTLEGKPARLRRRKRRSVEPK